MSKRSSVKNHVQNVAKENVKKLSATKQHELNILVDSLIKFGGQKNSSAADHWNQYLEMYMVLERIRKIESELKLKIHNSGKNRQAAIDNFCRWASDNGCQYKGVKITEFAGYELGLEATKDFKKDEVFVTVPKKMIFSDDSENSLPDIIKQIPMIQNLSNMMLSLLLIIERFKPNSFWKPYLDILPEKYATVLYFTPTDMQELKGTSAFLPAIWQCKVIAKQYGFVKKFIQNKSTTLLKDTFTYELYCWAVSTVMTRQNLIPGTTPEDASNPKSVLIPFWDMANHMNGTITTGFNDELERVESWALKDFKKGEQIFIHYGNRSNSDFLVHNGFVFPGNPNTSMSIHLSLSHADELFEDRKTLLEKIKIPVSGDFQIARPPNCISSELLGFVRVFNMTKEQLDHWLATEARVADLLHIDCALETSLESKTWNFLSTRFLLLLRTFATSVEEDEALLANQHLKGQPKLGHMKSMLIQYRIIEKMTLIVALDFAKSRIKV